ncbi:hypothetical protein BK141_29340 [Paenibacillus sp. FSL R5-0765]|uniref:hypothetical protein n=1 Tax=Paenibacillus sp. FSL R5-0765 TaxID=1920425 RepID=UPI00096DC894|nr:hypothetical protein [Paenibacillus sp. FSL R5-0765]OMF54086.1 hypothetical protein BK141_29340 [Paenibacillus sp. FSL R5-0765]
MTLDTIVQECGAERFLEELGNKLITGTYRPPACRTERDSETGCEDSSLGIPVIADRVVDIDIQGYFDNIPHEKLIRA